MDEWNKWTRSANFHTAINIIKPKKHYFCEVTMNAMKNDPYPTKQTADSEARCQSLPIWGDLEGYFGEQYIDQRTTGWDAMFTFSGKERDQETGYSYFGARYYDSDLSIWLSVDPLASEYPHQSNYVYCSNNPIRLIDPDGMDEWEINNKGDVVWKNNNGGEEQHTLHAVNKKGQRTGKSTEVKNRDILDQLSVSKGKREILANVRGDILESGNARSANGGKEDLDDMLNVFKFASDNTNVEWNFEYGKENGKTKYIVGTSGLSSMVEIFMGKGKITGIHSHHDVEKDANSEYGSMALDRKDSREKTHLQYIYMTNSGNLYNVKDGRSTYIKKITTHKDFPNVGR